MRLNRGPKIARAIPEPGLCTAQNRIEMGYRLRREGKAKLIAESAVRSIGAEGQNTVFIQDDTEAAIRFTVTAL